MNAYNLNWHLLKCLYNFLFPFALGSNSKFEQETSYINPIDNSLRIEMTSKKYIGQFISIKYSDRINPISGFVIDYNDDWTLLKFNPVDYVIDGYIILRHKNIEGFQRNANEKFKEKVIMLKKQHQPDLSEFPLTDLETILSSLTKKYGVFQFDLKSEKACYLGKLKSFTKGKLTIDYLNPKGLWTKQMQFRPNDIRTIEFDTDYINSLKLISKRGKPKI